MPLTASLSRYFDSRTVTNVASPWSVLELPGGQLLVTQRPAVSTVNNPTAPGAIFLIDPAQAGAPASPVPLAGLPENVGMLDIMLDPNYADNHIVYFSFMERDPSAPRIGRNAADTTVDPAGVVVAKAVLDLSGPVPALSNVQVLWEQTKVVSYPGSGEPGGKLAISPDGLYLFIASGDRQEFEPVQSLENSLGKVIRLFLDGSVPSDNPFVGVAGALPEIWTLGHRNPYGLTFDQNGVLWLHEMGPMGGDELNVITSGGNYGWPFVSDGNHYDGGDIPNPTPEDPYIESAISWTPVIAPSGMIAYTSDALRMFSDSLIISGLQSRGLVVVGTAGTTAVELTRISLGARTRDLLQTDDGRLFVITDTASGQLIELTPRTNMPTQYSGDFDGDGRSDILWRSDDGVLSNWLGTATGGFAVNDSAALQTVSTDWSVIASGDFNGDGKSDLLWRRVDGRVSDWLGQAGGGFVVNDTAAAADVSIDWQVVGSGDFNGDGRDDILWRSADGILSNWLGRADGGFAINDVNARATDIGPGWYVSGVGDFNGDGRDDIVWRNDDGSMSTWLGTAAGGFFRNDAASQVNVGGSWNIVGTGDFNGDGFDDLLWRRSDGTISNWLGNASGGFTPNDSFALSSVTPAWHVIAVGDYNGDGRADILWRHEDGRIANWLGTATGGFVANDANSLHAVSTDWFAGPEPHLLF